MRFGDKLDAVWQQVSRAMPTVFTTEDYIDTLKRLEPRLWKVITDVYGPGGKGSGNYYSPAKAAFNFLKWKAREWEITRRPFVAARSGWGTTVVAEWEQNPVEASDLPDPPKRIKTKINRIVRDTKISRTVKRLHNYECQLCGGTINLPNGRRYAEGHHVQPLGGKHKGPDKAANVLCVCPNCHAELDLGARPIDVAALRTVNGHRLEQVFADYHNNKIYPGKK